MFDAESSIWKSYNFFARVKNTDWILFTNKSTSFNSNDFHLFPFIVHWFLRDYEMIIRVMEEISFNGLENWT